MPIDPSIPLRAVTDYGSPLDMAAKAMSLKHLMQQDAMLPLQQQTAQLGLQSAQMGLQKQQEDVAKEQAVTEAFRSAYDPVTGRLDKQKALASVYTVDPKTAAELGSKWAKEDSAFLKQVQDSHKNFIATAGPLAKTIVDEYDKQIAAGVPEAVAESTIRPRIETGMKMLTEAGYGGEFHGGDPQAVTIDALRAMRDQWGKGMDIDARREDQARADRRLEQSDIRIDQAERRMQSMEDRAATNAQNSELTQDDLNFMADQYIAGDTTVGAGLGYGAQGSKNRVNLRRAIRERAEAQGLSPEQVASKVAEFQGIKAAQRALGTREAAAGMAASEAQQFADIALEASKRFKRTGFPPVNRALRAYEENTGDPDVVAFGAANNSLINAYARAISPTGTPTVHDKEHAREMISTAHTQAQYESIVKQMHIEMAAALTAPDAVRRNLRNSVTGGNETQQYNVGDVVSKGGKQYKVVGLDTDGHPLVEPAQ